MNDIFEFKNAILIERDFVGMLTLRVRVWGVSHYPTIPCGIMGYQVLISSGYLLLHSFSLSPPWWSGYEWYLWIQKCNSNWKGFRGNAYSASKSVRGISLSHDTLRYHGLPSADILRISLAAFLLSISPVMIRLWMISLNSKMQF